jgi:hypothetical protein
MRSAAVLSAAALAKVAFAGLYPGITSDNHTCALGESRPTRIYGVATAAMLEEEPLNEYYISRFVTNMRMSHSSQASAVVLQVCRS